MNGKILTFLSVLVALVGIAQYVRVQINDVNHVPQGTQSVHFDEIAPGLHRFARTWPVVHKLVEIHISTFLVKSGKDYILIDAGVPSSNYTDLFLDAMKAATKNGNLRMVLLTHAHVDHVGSLLPLLEAFPKAQVAMHILEAPYAGGGVRYSTVPADNWAYTILRRLIPEDKLQLPVHRLLFVAGKGGDISEVKGAAGQAPAWVPPSGLLEYVHVPGHSPGQLAFLHRPSSSLLPADVIVHVGAAGAYSSKPSPPTLMFPPPGSSSNWTQHALDWRALAQLNFTTAFPSHDIATGVSKAAIVEFADKLARS